MKDTVEAVADRRRARHVSRACVICRRRKTKCNGAEPACGTCLVHGLKCEYSSEPDKRKTKEDSQELAALKLRVAALEDRVRAYEGSSAKNTPGKGSPEHLDAERLTAATSSSSDELGHNSPNALSLVLHGAGDDAKGDE